MTSHPLLIKPLSPLLLHSLPPPLLPYSLVLQLPPALLQVLLIVAFGTLLPGEPTLLPWGCGERESERPLRWSELAKLPWEAFVGSSLCSHRFRYTTKRLVSDSLSFVLVLPSAFCCCSLRSRARRSLSSTFRACSTQREEFILSSL